MDGSGEGWRAVLLETAYSSEDWPETQRDTEGQRHRGRETHREGHSEGQRDSGRERQAHVGAQGGVCFGVCFVTTPVPTLPSVGGVSVSAQWGWDGRGCGARLTLPPWPQAPADSSGCGRGRRPLGQPDCRLPGLRGGHHPQVPGLAQRQCLGHLWAQCLPRGVRDLPARQVGSGRGQGVEPVETGQSPGV